MRSFLAVVTAALVAGCGTTREKGVVTLSVEDPGGKKTSAYSFVYVDVDGKTISQIPAQGNSQALHGGVFTLLVITSAGAGTFEVEVDGATEFTAKLGKGGSVRGQARADMKPIPASVWMPVPGKDADDSPFSYRTRAKDDGRFHLDRLPPGKWTIYVGNEAAGYKPVEVKIKEGETFEAGIIEVR